MANGRAGWLAAALMVLLALAAPASEPIRVLWTRTHAPRMEAARSEAIRAEARDFLERHQIELVDAGAAVPVPGPDARAWLGAALGEARGRRCQGVAALLLADDPADPMRGTAVLQVWNLEAALLETGSGGVAGFDSGMPFDERVEALRTALRGDLALAEHLAPRVRDALPADAPGTLDERIAPLLQRRLKTIDDLSRALSPESQAAWASMTAQADRMARLGQRRYALLELELLFARTGMRPPRESPVATLPAQLASYETLLCDALALGAERRAPHDLAFMMSAYESALESQARGDAEIAATSLAQGRAVGDPLVLSLEAAAERAAPSGAP
ncbi:MAG: hypothetical protein SF028_14165 [Candidatus Sumerlaeia bacterium]|nr:hypothetical protein [Candidatus Sumerlaeia bacterium]